MIRMINKKIMIDLQNLNYYNAQSPNAWKVKEKEKWRKVRERSQNTLEKEVD